MDEVMVGTTKVQRSGNIFIPSFIRKSLGYDIGACIVWRVRFLEGNKREVVLVKK